MTTPGHLKGCICPYCNMDTANSVGLSAGITLEQIIESFTEPGKQFQFPIEAIPVKLDKTTQSTIILGTIILGSAAIMVSMIAAGRR